MFNLKQAQVTSYEKYLRENQLVPSKEPVSITEKNLEHEGGKDTTTQDQLNPEHSNEDKEAFSIIEKVLNDVDGKYVDHRKVSDNFTIPPINALVEKIRQDRMSNEYKVDNEKHWTVSFDDKKQLGDLPRGKQIPGPQDTMWDKNVWDKRHPEADEVVKGVTKADINQMIASIKTGQTLEYDTAITAILRQAHKEKRDLSTVEQNTISQLKIARSNFLLSK